MTTQPEDLFSPEDEAEMQRNFVRGHGEEVLEAMGQMIEQMEEHPELREPRAVEFMAEALAAHKLWLRQNGIALPQPDVDETK